MIKGFAAKAAKAKLEPFEYDPGPLKDDEVEIAVSCCGICHSDISMIQNDWKKSQYPLIPGHEVVGMISQVGKNVTQLKKGDRVGLGWHAGYCLTCMSCMQGEHNLCPSAIGTIVSHHGGFANAVRAQAESVVKIPDEIEDEVAGPLFCAGITVFTPLLHADVLPTHRVAVIGIGGLGHLALQFYRAWGCEVTAFTSSASKAEEAKKLGAHKVINSSNPEELKQAANQFDFILSTVNVHLDWNAYIECLGPNGKLHFVGITLDPLDIQAPLLIHGQKFVTSSEVGTPANIAKMLEFAARHGVKPIVEVFAMDQVNEALDHLKSGKARYRIVLTQK